MPPWGLDEGIKGGGVGLSKLPMHWTARLLVCLTPRKVKRDVTCFALLPVGLLKESEIDNCCS